MNEGEGEDVNTQHDLHCVVAMVPWPPFCCIIIRNPSGKFLAEHRGKSNAVQPSRLTCFGGKREREESPRGCLMRECAEELGWTPPEDAVSRAVSLFVNGHLIAWFYSVLVDVGEEATGTGTSTFTFEEDRGASGLWTDAADPRFSPWHAAVLQAYLLGDKEAHFNDGDAASTAALLRSLPTATTTATATVPQKPVTVHMGTQ